MELTKKLKLNVLDILFHKYFTWPSIALKNVKGFTFTPSTEFIEELTSSYTVAKIEEFENGPTFSAYEVEYFKGPNKGHAIYKATTITYPIFTKYVTQEEYNRSFCFND